MSSSKFLRYYRELDKSLPSTKTVDLTYQKERDEILQFLQPYDHNNSSSHKITSYQAKPLKYHGKLARIRSTSVTMTSSSKASHSSGINRPNSSKITKRPKSSSSSSSAPTTSNPHNPHLQSSQHQTQRHINQLVHRNESNKSILQELQQYVDNKQIIPKQIVKKLMINEERLSSVDEKYQHAMFYEQHQLLLKGQVPSSSGAISSTTGTGTGSGQSTGGIGEGKKKGIKKKLKSTAQLETHLQQEQHLLDEEQEAHRTPPRAVPSSSSSPPKPHQSPPVSNKIPPTKGVSSTNHNIITLPAIMMPNPHVLSISTTNLHQQDDGPSSQSPVKFVTKQYSPIESYRVENAHDRKSKYKWSKAERQYMMTLFHELPLPSTFLNNAGDVKRNQITKQMQLNTNQIELWKLYLETFAERFLLLFHQHPKDEVILKAQEMIKKKQYKFEGEEEYWLTTQFSSTSVMQSPQQQQMVQQFQQAKREAQKGFTKYDIYYS